MTGVTRPVLLDLFACEGSASQGYADAGFEVWAVDNAPARLRHNPHAWFLGDWLEGLHRALATGRVAAVHASPPCFLYSRGTAALDRSVYPDLIGPVREVLQATGLPYVIENVEDAWDQLRSPVLLCGSHFGLGCLDTDGTPLRLERHRLFESNRRLGSPGPCWHDPAVQVAGSYGGARSDRHEARYVRRGGYVPKAVETQRALLGAPSWLTKRGCELSIPPAYSRWVGERLLAAEPMVPAEQLGLFA